MVRSRIWRRTQKDMQPDRRGREKKIIEVLDEKREIWT